MIVFLIIFVCLSLFLFSYHSSGLLMWGQTVAMIASILLVPDLRRASTDSPLGIMFAVDSGHLTFIKFSF